MWIKEVTYTDYFGNQRTEKCHFQLSESELTELAYSVKGGFIAAMTRMIDDRNEPELVENYKKLLLLAYGEISPDGRRFMKSEELSREFSQTPMYDKIFMELTTSETALSDFVRNVIPQNLSNDLPDNISVDTLKDLVNSKPAIETTSNADGQNT